MPQLTFIANNDFEKTASPLAQSPDEALLLDAYSNAVIQVA